jgi:hypothetical protein
MVDEEEDDGTDDDDEDEDDEEIDILEWWRPLTACDASRPDSLRAPDALAGADAASEALLAD